MKAAAPNCRSLPGRAGYRPEIDFIKAAAIIAVILLHSLPAPILLVSLAPFHIWQAVPIFIMAAGFTGTLATGRGFYSQSRFRRLFSRFLVPFLVVWMVEVMILIFAGKAAPGRVAGSLFTGGSGPGSYFIPLFFQHLLVFPFLLRLKRKVAENRQPLLLAALFVFALLLDWGCRVLAVPQDLYRLLYVRYLFAAVLGSWLAESDWQGKKLLAGALAGAFYIYLVSYRGSDFLLPYPAWGFQHAPAYLYTAGLFVLLWRVAEKLSFLDRLLLPLGRASYHIFLFQMVWFWKVAHHLTALPGGLWSAVPLNLMVCLAAGRLFFQWQNSSTGR